MLKGALPGVGKMTLPIRREYYVKCSNYSRELANSAAVDEKVMAAAFLNRKKSRHIEGREISEKKWRVRTCTGEKRYTAPSYTESAI